MHSSVLIRVHHFAFSISSNPKNSLGAISDKTSGSATLSAIIIMYSFCTIPTNWCTQLAKKAKNKESYFAGKHWRGEMSITIINCHLYVIADRLFARIAAGTMVRNVRRFSFLIISFPLSSSLRTKVDTFL